MAIKKVCTCHKMADGTSVFVHEYYGLSTDTKPTDAENASVFYEMDTQTAFMYDSENSQWIEQ